MQDYKMSPVLKWAGGKGQLLEALRERMPEEYGCYYEPFIGGAALLFNVVPEQAVVNDINEQLVNLYRQLKEHTDELIAKIDEYDQVSCDKEHYMEMRARYNEKIANKEMDVECAALMVWINKHCFNGLYRVNKKGLFNVPYNNKTNGKSMDDSNLREIGAFLNDANVKITCMDFEKICEGVKPGDFVYFDSPYVPESETADFTAYAKDGFTMEDHERLATLYRKLDKLGAKVMLSNNDVPLIHKLYEGFNIHSLQVKRLINRNAANRKGMEVIITNY